MSLTVVTQLFAEFKACSRKCYTRKLCGWNESSTHPPDSPNLAHNDCLLIVETASLSFRTGKSEGDAKVSSFAGGMGVVPD